jgi:hypothetical protein
MTNNTSDLLSKMNPVGEIDWSTVPVTINWEQKVHPVNTVLTTHVWTSPQQQKGKPLYDKLYSALENFGSTHQRFLPWFTHPRVAVPEIDPPTETGTSWDFSRLDPYVEDFMKINEGKPVVANFATIPTWMFKVDNPLPVPEDPEVDFWPYEQGNELRDPTMKEVADYFYRLASWYIKGGFTDEHGKYHESGHHYKFDYWEVLCEPDLGHAMTVETYTKLYDAVVERLQELDPDMKFIGLSVSHMVTGPEYFWYFLDPKNHKPGIPLDAISYHFYAGADINNTFVLEQNAPYSEWRGIFYAQADGFLARAKFIDSIRKRLSPATETHINEIGTFSPDFMNPATSIPDDYWALSASLFAYIWSGLIETGVEVASIAELFDYPGMFAGATLVNWETGEPNERYWAAKLLLDSFKSGDTAVFTFAGQQEGNFNRIHAKAFVSADGKKRVLLINKYKDPIAVSLPMEHATVSYVDTTTGSSPAATKEISDGRYKLGPYATAVVTLK